MNVFRSLFRFSAVALLMGAFLLLNAPQAEAQYFAFGKNRVQYKNFDWRYIQSTHFDVYYYQSKNYDLATFAALALEAALKQIQEDFGHRIADRIQVVIYDSHVDFSETNVVALPIYSGGIGGVTDLFKNRITMPFAGDYDKFRAVLHHELVHAVINDMFYGGSVQSLVSGNALQIPLWFNEGLAEFEANGWDTNSDLYIRDAIIHDYLAPIKQLRGYYAYRGGQSLWNYIVKEYGRSKIEEIMQTMKSLRNVEAAFQRTLGLTIEQLSERWKDYYRERYLPEVAERVEIDNIADLVAGHEEFGTYNTSPSYSPQGDKLAMITNARGYFDVVIVNAITGEKIKTIAKGQNTVNFENLNILYPNISWSPDGSKIILSAESEGWDQLAIIDVSSGAMNFIKFPNIDAINSVAWSPDGEKIAFDGNIGPFMDIFVYNLQTQELTNLTKDVFSDRVPAWSADSQTLYFSSARGDHLQLGQMDGNVELLAGESMYTTDIYAVTIGDNSARRMTQTPEWNEKQPKTTSDGRLIYISDANGIPNVYELNMADRTSRPLTNLQTGAMQISVSADGSRLAISTLNEGNIDIFSMTTPFNSDIKGEISDNEWALQRASTSLQEFLPAIGYVQQLVQQKEFVTTRTPKEGYSPDTKPVIVDSTDTALVDSAAINAPVNAAVTDTLPADTAAVTKTDSTKTEADPTNIDFRNYVFSSDVTEDTVFTNKYMDENVFELEDNATKDERFVPTEYRLRFTTDLVFAGGGFSTYYGSYGLVQIRFSDLLGDHRITFGSSLQFDLRNSDYFLQYGNFKGRVDWLFNVSHTAYQLQGYTAALRYRYFTGGVTARYPFNIFERIDFNLSAVSIARDYTSFRGGERERNNTTTFLYPQVIYTKDKTMPGLLTPRGGFRYAIGLSASPPITNETLQFVSLLGDFRKYFSLGGRYSFAVRGSGGVSFGRDSQTYFMGGMLGWINRKYANTVPAESFASSFISQPAIPLRGHEYFAISGDKFTLANLEFRFPLFAAILPGPIPILPLYNLTGVAFIDAGMAWGKDVPYDIPGTNQTYYVNDGELDFAVREQSTMDVNVGNGSVELPAPQGDILLGAGFGLRTIIFGLPLRYDIGWPYYRGGFDGDPIHYISIGIDF